MSRRALLLVCLVVLSGCAAIPSLPDGPPFADESSPTPAPPTTDERAIETTAGATVGPTGTAVPRPNPYEEETLTVAISDEADTGRDFRPLVREALDFWEANDRRYVGYSVEYRLVSDAEDADLLVRFVESVDECGREDHVAGCAPLVTAGPVDRPVTVRVRSGFSDDSTVLVLQHELGHTLGLGHDDAPADVMNARSVLTTLPQRNASEKALPWNRSTLSVYVDTATVPPDDLTETRRQVDAALGYFEDGAEGTVPEEVSFVRARSPEEADVVVRFSEESPCQPGPGSCGAIAGLDPDGDGALETYTRLEITLTDLDTDAVAWHVARWLGQGMGLEGEELPEPLRETSTFGERRGEWWA
ncbi:zinc-dependent metalloprotease family protein [Halomarina litorea]|uniref:zinc-dependent metalloprotease family protein n=1 Tax=Halomarina litorea TaxID=2961595 RepID=UPI0020C398E4|nr:zinc-dependent metalloprotease family protein [Halomarina sp. BCD28]